MADFCHINFKMYWKMSTCKGDLKRKFLLMQVNRTVDGQNLLFRHGQFGHCCCVELPMVSNVFIPCFIFELSIILYDWLMKSFCF